MALNIKDPVTERLAARVAELTADTKTGAIRTALEERLHRLTEEAGRAARAERVRAFLVDEAWPQIPADVVGIEVSKGEREAILGIGPEGV
jgi:antitoxin VapB